VLLVPTVSSTLWNHPAWSQNLETLASAGARFDPSWVRAALVRLTSAGGFAA
jgi:hypothetical protein